jgi:hypothetical protein
MISEIVGQKHMFYYCGGAPAGGGEEVDIIYDISYDVLNGRGVEKRA